MKINIETIRHYRQRYETLGDYWYDPDGRIQVRVSSTGNDDYDFLIMIHELIEEHLTKRRGLSEPDIKAFDEKYEKEREEGFHKEDDEPGFDERAPYRVDHTISTGVELLLCGIMGLDWEAYGRKLNEISACRLKQRVEGTEVPNC
jgi:hypothetical protein